MDVWSAESGCAVGNGANVSTVVVNGGDSPLGRHVADLARTDPDVTAVVDPTALRPGGVGTDGPVDVILLAPTPGPDRDGSTVGGVDLAGAGRLLDRLDGLPVRSVVVLSSAMVYGAWSDNPVPLTEDAVLRPNPTCRFAADKAELERLVVEWAGARVDGGSTATSVARLRPTLTLSHEPGSVEWMEASLWHTPTARHGEADPPAQFLHIDDLARAIEHARRERLDGAFNVAPDGWVASDRQLELTGKVRRVRVPSRLAGRVAGLRWRLRLTSTPPEVVPYLLHPWVVANDRLRGTGWAANWSNDEVFVAANRPGWWSSLTARRRQDVALGALVAGLVVAGGVVAAVARRARTVEGP